MTKLIVHSRNFANAPKKSLPSEVKECHFEKRGHPTFEGCVAAGNKTESVTPGCSSRRSRTAAVCLNSILLRKTTSITCVEIYSKKILAERVKFYYKPPAKYAVAYENGVAFKMLKTVNFVYVFV